MESFWAGFRLDPRLPRNAPLRASDADREVVRSLLGDAFADGRLTREEYDDRVTELFETRTLGELPALVEDLADPEDLPAEPARTPSRAAPVEAIGPAAEFRARAEASYRKELSEAVWTFAIIALITWAVWLSAGHHFPWPIFPSAVFGLRVVRTVSDRDSSIDAKVRRLQRRQLREAEAAGTHPEDRADQDGALPPASPPQPPIRLDKPDQREQSPQERPEERPEEGQ